MPLMMGDWIRGTRGMKAEVRGVYISLLIHQYDNGYIPNDIEELRLIDPEIDKVWDRLKAKFTLKNEGQLVNNKLEEVRNFFNKQKANGLQGGRPPKPKLNPNNNPEMNPNHNLHNEYEYDNDIDIELSDNNGEKNFSKNGYGEKVPISMKMKSYWMERNPKYPISDDLDLPALVSIDKFIRQQLKDEKKRNGDQFFGNKVSDEESFERWKLMCGVVMRDKFYSDKQLDLIAKKAQSFWMVVTKIVDGEINAVTGLATKSY